MFEIPAIVIYIIFFIDFFIAFFFLTVFIRSKLTLQSFQNKQMDITFVLPAFNCSKVLEKSVNSIENVKYPREKIKIIIVNDGSSDDTLEIANKLVEKYGNIQVFSKKNEGRKAFPINYGLRFAKTELVAVLDADTLLKEDILEKAIPMFNNHTVAVTTRMKPLYENKLIEKLQAVEYTFAGFYRMIMGNINALSVAPAFTIFRREAFLKYGYFDTENLTEDLEMGMRLQSKHHDIGYVAESYVITDVPSSFFKLFRQRLRWGYGTLQNYKKYRKMFFNPEYGDLGIFILPAGFLSIMIMSLVFLAGVYSSLSFLIKRADLLWFGWQPSFSINWTEILLYFTNLRIILFIMAFVVGLGAFFLIRYELGEKIKFRYYALYLTAYLWMLGLFYIISIAYFVLGRKPKW